MKTSRRQSRRINFLIKWKIESKPQSGTSINSIESKDDINQATNTMSFQLSSGNTQSQLSFQPPKQKSKTILRPSTESSQANCQCSHQNILNQQMVDLMLKNEQLEQQNAILLNQNEWQDKTIENLTVKVTRLEKILQSQEIRLRQISNQRQLSQTQASPINDKTPQRQRVRSQHTITKAEQQPFILENKNYTPSLKQEETKHCFKLLNCLQDTLIQERKKEQILKDELYNIKDVLEKSDRQNSSVESRQSTSLINLNQTLKRVEAKQKAQGQTNTVLMKEIIDVMISRNQKDKQQMMKENIVHQRKKSQNYFDWESRQNKLITQVLREVKENINQKPLRPHNTNEQKPSTRYDKSSSAKRTPSKSIL